MSMVHDNVILSYEVDLQNERIILHTRYDDSRSVEETDIIFTDVLNHWFEQQLKGSIIFDISESEISHFVKENSELLIKNKAFGWPMMYESIDDFERLLTDEKYKYINLSSSYGMNGWVLAKNLDIITRKIEE